MEKEASRIYFRGEGRLHLRKPRIYWGEPGNPLPAPVIHIRRTKPEHRLYIRKPRIYWGEPGHPQSAPVIYVRKKPRSSWETSKNAA